jgi:hypothetical protein
MRIYEQLVARFGQSEVSNQMELQDKAVSFRVIDAAVTPTAHIFPKRYLWMIGGIMLGFVLAGAVVLGNDLLRGKIRSAHDLNVYALPILIKLPSIAPPDTLARQNRSTFTAAAVTVCLLLLICAAAAMEFLDLPYIEKSITFFKRVFLS